MGILNRIISLSLCISAILTPYSVNDAQFSFYAGGSNATAKLGGSKYSTYVSAETFGPIPCEARADVCGTYMGASGHRMWAYGYGRLSTNAYDSATAQFSNCASCYWVAIDGDHTVVKDGVTYTYHSHVDL